MAEINVPVERYQELLTLALRMNEDIKKLCDEGKFYVAITTSGYPFSVWDFEKWLAEQTEGADENK